MDKEEPLYFAAQYEEKDLFLRRKIVLQPSRKQLRNQWIAHLRNQ